MRKFARSLVLMAAVSFSTLAFAQTKSFVSDDLASNAIRLEAQARKDGAGLANGRSTDQLAKDAQTLLNRRDSTNALRAFTAMIAQNPKDSAAWLAYSKALAAVAETDINGAWRLRENAATAAYGAYERAASKADEAKALAWLGDLYNNRSLYRSALNAYRASLAALDEPKVRKTYEDIREKHGFRIVDYKVDNDSASPRVCFNFSENLAKGKVDFAPFVAVSGASNAAITNEDQQLCVEGLKHGDHYTIILRQGLPSSVNETLLKSADYDIYVKDRSPQVRFTGKNYVLPRVGQEGIPVISVNTPKVAVDVLRIGDRNLIGTLRSEDFLAQLTTYKIKKYVENEGVKVWSGTLDVKPDTNKDVTTAFPVSDAVGKLQPGVYLMTAKAGEKPAAGSEEDDEYSTLATQWFIVSDLGLTSFSANDGVHGLVRSLASAEPMSGVEVRLVARNNEILATKTTDSNGAVRFDPGLSRGLNGLAPGVLVAMDSKGDYGFLDLQQTAFDLTDRGVKGRTAAKSADALVYTERGVYRSGETVHISTLLRDAKGVAMPGLPVTLVVKRPDGVEYKRVQVEDQGLGGRAYSLSLLSGAATGTWRVQAFTDPKSPAIGEASFLVEDYVPERLEFKLSTAAKAVRAEDKLEIKTETRYLYGAPGAGLEISGEMEIRAAEDSELPALKGYSAGLTDEKFEAQKSDIDEKVTTDAKGLASVTLTIPDSEAQRPLEAKVVLRAGEPGGRAVERTLHIPILPKGGLIGVKKNFETLGEGATATFDVIAVDADGLRTTRRNVGWSLYRVSNDYQWYNSDGRWGYERVKSSKRVAEGKLNTSDKDAGKISVPVDLGSYRLDLRSENPTDAPTSITFDAGWSGENSAQAPDLLDVTVDKAAYKSGDDVKLRIASRFAGKATIAIIGEKVSSLTLVDLKIGDNTTSIKANSDWGSGVYAVALAHRPLDKAANRMPGRSLGLAWFSVDADAHKLDIAIGAPAKVRPRNAMNVPLTIAGLKAGEEAFVTVSAVDIGILNLTNYETPDPRDHFYGQQQLSAEIRDLYGLLIDGMQGARGTIRSGGDAAAKGLEGNRPTQEPLALYSGVVKVGADGKANVTFDLPAFNGSVRVTTVAWSKDKAGSNQMDVIVRDPVVVQATLPRFLSLGDQSRLHMQIDNVEGQPGEYTLDIDVRGPISVPADALRKVVKLETGGRTSLTIPVTAAGVGQAVIDLKMKGPGLDAPQSFAINVTPGTSELYRRDVRSVAAGTSLTISSDLIADFLPGTGAVSVAVSPFGGIDVPALLQALDRYPYGCTEQTVSRALPLLYVNKLASIEHLSMDADVEERVKKAIERVLSRQDSNGAFGLWSASNADDMWLTAFVSDFLTRARENGFAVPQKSFDQALERLRNHVANTTDVKSADSDSIAYAIYVLARNGRPVMGDLRYLADTKLDAFDNGLSRAQLAASLALLGDKGRAATVFTKASEQLATYRNGRYSRSDYGSRLRDGAGVLALAAEAGLATGELVKASAIVEEENAATRYSSTQEKSWMVLAAQALAKQADNMAVTVDEKPHKGALYRTWRAASLDGRRIVIGNAGQGPMRVVITTSGNPQQPEPAAAQGYELERSFYKLDGTKADPLQIKQNERLVVVLKVTEVEAAYARLLLVDHLPAGLEIDNPNLVDSGTLSALSWLKKDVDPVNTEYRDDRFVAAFERGGRDKATFSVAYIVRAVSPGKYVLPPVTIEDMYRPDRFGRSAFGTVEVSASK